MAIGDLKGWKYANSDVRGYLAVLSILQVFVVVLRHKLSRLNESNNFKRKKANVLKSLIFIKY